MADSRFGRIGHGGTATQPRYMEAAMGGVHERPYIIFPIAFAAGLIGWWLKGIKSDGRVAGYEGTIVSLKATNEVYEARLKLAADQTDIANKAKDDAESNQRLLKAEIAARASKDDLAALAAKVDIAIANFAVANNAVRSAVTGVLSATESPDTANFHGTIE